MRRVFLRTLLFALMRGVGLAAWFRRRNRRQAVVLMYHGVVPDEDPMAHGDWLQVRVSEFRQQMAYLKKHYEVVPLADLLRPQPAAPGRPRAAVTFDDGYANVYRCALPVLRELGLPATVFVVTGHVDTRRLFWWDRLHLAALPAETAAAHAAALKALPPARIDAALARILEASGRTVPAEAPESYRCASGDELRALTASGLIDLGSHTHGHEILQGLSDEDTRATLRASLQALAGWGIATRLLAAPNGDYTEAQTMLMREQGFAACVSTRPGLWSHPALPYRIPRFGIGRGTGLAEFALTISGCLLWLRARRGRADDGRY